MITLKLDSSAVATLVEKDPDVKLELQQAVVAEITRRMFEKYVPNDVRQLIDAVFKSQRNELVDAVKDDTTFQKRFTALFEKEICNIKSNWGHKEYNVTPAMKEKMNAAVKEQCDKILKEAALTGEQLIKQVVEDAFNRVQVRALASIDSQIERKVAAFTNDEIDRRVQARLKAALEAK